MAADGIDPFMRCGSSGFDNHGPIAEHATSPQ
jgi:hypothetical protein